MDEFIQYLQYELRGVSLCPYDAMNVADALLRPDLLKREKITYTPGNLTTFQSPCRSSRI